MASPLGEPSWSARKCGGGGRKRERIGEGPGGCEKRNAGEG